MLLNKQVMPLVFVFAIASQAIAEINGAPAKTSTLEQLLQAWRAGTQKSTSGAVKKTCSSLIDCESAVTYGNLSEKAYAAGVLSTMGASAVPALTKALTDENEHIRDIAATSLRRIGPDAKDAIPALIKLLGDNATFRTAQDALGSIGKAAIPDLIALFPEPEEGTETKEAKSQRWRIRRRAVSVFGAIGAVAVPELIEILNSENDDGLSQDFAAEALGDIGPAAKDAVPALIQHITESNRYRKKSKQNLGQYQWTLKNTLITLRESDITWGASALGKIGPDAKDAVPKLLSLLQGIKDEEFNLNKHVLVEALGGIGAASSASVPTLIQLLKDPNADVRLVTIVALGKMGPAAQEAKVNLEAIAKYADSEQVKSAAKTAISKISSKS